FVSARRDSFPDRATTPETNFFSRRDDGTRSWEHSFPLPLSHPLGGRDEPPCLTFANPPQQLISPKRPALRHPPSPIGFAQIPAQRKQGRSGSLCATDFQPHPLRTDRLRLRRWLPDDRVPFARLNSDPRVMEFFPGVLSREESAAMADRIEAHFERHGFGLWAVEIPGSTPFAGFIGLAVPRFEAPFT